MTVKNPPNTVTHKATIRMPDEIVRKIDDWNEKMYVSRPDFVLAAVREFAFDCIYLFEQEIINCEKTESDEEKFASFTANTTYSIGDLTEILAEEMRKDRNTTQMMIYIPEGLKIMIEYVMEMVPIINSINTFARIATVYKIRKTANEQETAIRVTDFINSFGKLNRSEFAMKVKEIRDKKSPRKRLTVFNENDNVVGSLDEKEFIEKGQEHIG